MSLWNKLFGSEEAERAQHGLVGLGLNNAGGPSMQTARPEPGNKAPAAPRPFDSSAEKGNFLKAVNKEWGRGVEFYAGETFRLIGTEYVSWFAEQAQARRMYCTSYRETAALELLEALRGQGKLTKRVAVEGPYKDERRYYKLR